MKKIFYILSICVMTILQPSCDALDLAPEDYYGAGNFWKEASQPKAFMLGLHAQLRSYYDMFYTLACRIYRSPSGATTPCARPCIRCFSTTPSKRVWTWRSSIPRCNEKDSDN